MGHQRIGALTKRATVAPVMGGQNFPDPSVIKVSDGWHAFSTNGGPGKSVHVQVAFTPDFKNWQFRGTKDAMPKLASWIDPKSPRVWAPDVNQLGDGSFIMYYTAALKSKTNLHCLGWAKSTGGVEGPYVDNSNQPWICPTNIGGAIDPSGYVDPQNRRWVVYKVDGNAIGHGGECGNTIPPIVPTPIMLQQVGQDGHTLIGSPQQLITNGALDGPYVEAPSLTKMGDKFFLFFSSQCFATPKYDVSYAIADNIKGPYTRHGPLFVTGSYGMTAPGGLDIAVNGNRAVWHGNYGSGRAMYTGTLKLNGNQIVATLS
ncbi:hypothetical protein D0866_14548 [Hortaea werneckii]|uniref:Glycoside hydrolase family 43 protein n=1 Tax=Hortaea werneckii TaxID=91943 RepID=A0A3M6Z3V5_HORWE|nr:hypothetical protein D0866_14548 [Hortaea werneckii]